MAGTVKVVPFGPEGKHGHPFGAALELPEEMVQEEFRISGVAHNYTVLGELSVSGRWNVEPRDEAPFTTRILVTRPERAEHFNGTVVVEWANVSSGYDISLAALIPTGFAHVLVSAQVDGIRGFPSRPAGLTAWDPERYGELAVDDDSYSYDIFTQAARAVGPGRTSVIDRADPLAGLPVRQLIGIGGSQAGARVLAYLDAIQPIEHVFDAFLPFLSAGHAADFDPARAHADPGAADYDVRRRHSRATPARVREDLDVPVLQLNSEAEAPYYRSVWQPDTNRFRSWEVAGAAHGPADVTAIVRALADRDFLEIADWAQPTGTPVSWSPVLAAAVKHLARWAEGGAPAPSQPLIAMGGDPLTVERDRFGNALGGVRVPELDVPIARNVPGRVAPFDGDTLRELYASDADYRARLLDAGRDAVERGVVTKAHLDSLRKSAHLPESP